MSQDNYLFCPGPVNVDDKVRQALLHPQIGHRVPYFMNVIKNVQENLHKICKADDEYIVLLITGSGTAANESVISSYYTPEDEVLVVAAGEFGYRLVELLTIHNVKNKVVGYDWGEVPRVEDVEAALKESPSITSVATVFHETSTSVIHPVYEIGKLAKQYGKSYYVDAVSALGGEDLDVVRDNIDFCTCSSNKCLSGLAGVGIICARKSLLEKTRNNKTTVAYLNLHRLYDMIVKHGQTANTPSVTMFIALEAAVARLMEEGLSNQIERYKRCASILRTGLRKLGLETLTPDDVASNTVTSVLLPEDIKADELISRLEEKHYTIYAGKGPLMEKNMVQIANMGAIDEELCHQCLAVIEETLNELRT